MNGLFAQHTEDRPLRRVDAHLAARHDLQVKAADGVKVQIAFVVDVHDLETQLVGVPGEHDLGAASLVVDADGIAVHIDLDSVGVLFHCGLPHRPHRPLVARRAGSTEQIDEKPLGCWTHRSPYGLAGLSAVPTAQMTELTMRPTTPA